MEMTNWLFSNTNATPYNDIIKKFSTGTEKLVVCPDVGESNFTDGLISGFH